MIKNKRGYDICDKPNYVCEVCTGTSAEIPRLYRRIDAKGKRICYNCTYKLSDGTTLGQKLVARKRNTETAYDIRAMARDCLPSRLSPYNPLTKTYQKKGYSNFFRDAHDRRNSKKDAKNT